MLPSFFTRSVRVMRPTMTSSRGTEVPDWEHLASDRVFGGCSVQTPTTGEEWDGRTATRLTGTAYLPAHVDVRAGDAIEYMGERYLVVGEPMRWESPTGALDHKQVRIARWEG